MNGLNGPKELQTWIIGARGKTLETLLKPVCSNCQKFCFAARTDKSHMRLLPQFAKTQTASLVII